VGSHVNPARLNTRVSKPVKSSIRAHFVERRTYLRPLNEEGDLFETPKEALDRVMGHQRWLWEQALGRELNVFELGELSELRGLIEEKKVSVSGRVKWMGGTALVRERASGAFNCAFTNVGTPADSVDAFWLLLQGCFQAGTPVRMANGNYKKIEEIKEGDLVTSYDEKTGRFVAQRVERLNINQPKSMVRVTLANGEQIICTRDHKFFTTDGEWVEAQNLADREVVRHA
jgi:hypothetical protein